MNTLNGKEGQTKLNTLHKYAFFSKRYVEPKANEDNKKQIQLHFLILKVKIQLYNCNCKVVKHVGVSK